MLTTVDRSALVSQKSAELLARPPISAWAACASIWSRVFVLSGPGWAPRPDLLDKMREALSHALQRTVGIGELPSAEPLLADFQTFDIEDDGSMAWIYMVDLIEMLSAPIGGQDIGVCVKTSLRVYLDGVFNSLARGYAVAEGRPIPYSEAKDRIAGEVEWRRTIEFVRSLLSRHEKFASHLACGIVINPIPIANFK